MLLALLAAAGLGGGAAPPPSPPQGVRLHVSADRQAARAAAAAPAAGSAAEADALDVLAAQPTAVWLGSWLSPQRAADRTREVVAAAAAGGTVPVLVLYALPHRDCGGWSAGGSADAASYRAWSAAVAGALGPQRAVVVLEPDSLGQLDCLDGAARAERYALLRGAVRELTAHPATLVYLDGGHSDWLPAEEAAARLRRAGVAGARGFATNVSNARSTADEVAWGLRVSALTGGARFVVDTSRNGRGPATGGDPWCNPPGRALGRPPLSARPAPEVDALLWVKAPGESDGDCGRGEPAAGRFWPAYAVGLVQRRAW